MRLPQRDLHQQLRAESIASRDRITTLVRPLDAARLVQHPEQGGWSVGQVLEHLLVSEEAYDTPLRALLRGARPDAGAPAREWRSTLLGGFIAESLRKPRAVKTRPIFEPGPTVRNGIVEAFLAQELAFVTMLDDSASLDWRALKIGSPALPSFMPKMNLGDEFRIHVVHVTRHAGQIERLMQRL